MLVSGYSKAELQAAADELAKECPCEYCTGRSKNFEGIWGTLLLCNVGPHPEHPVEMAAIHVAAELVGHLERNKK